MSDFPSDFPLRVVVALPNQPPRTARAVLVGVAGIYVGSTRLQPADLLWADCCPTIRRQLEAAGYRVLPEKQSRWPDGLDAAP